MRDFLLYTRESKKSVKLCDTMIASMEHDILDKFTTHLRNVLARAYAIAIESQDDRIKPTHTLLALALEQGCVGADILAKGGFNPTRVRTHLTKTRTRQGNVNGGIPGLDDRTKQIIEKAVLIASVNHHTYVGTEHLLASLLESNEPEVLTMLTLSKANHSVIAQELQAVLLSTGKLPEVMRAMDYFEPDDGGEPHTHEHTHAKPEQPSKTQALDFFTTDLTAIKDTKIGDPLIGRDKEVERMVHILSRRTKNNPLLLGDPGVGKTAIVEGLARRIVMKEVPDTLLGKRILSLDLGLVIAGTMYRGEFEGRIKQIVDELGQNPDIILFIDEIHTIMGAGATNGSLDAANMLKPALARGALRCIGATTEAEFKKHIENDAALERRFQPIHVEEPTPEQTIAILHGIKHKYEQFHRVHIADEALSAAVTLAGRYLTERFFPDKAIDLLDEAAAHVAVATTKNNERRELIATEEMLEHIEKRKLTAMQKGDFDTALALKEKERRLKNKLYALKRRLHKHPQGVTGVVTSVEIAKVVAQITGVPLQDLTHTERDKLANLENLLNEKVIGQTAVIKDVAQSIRRARLGLASPNRPLASFLFVGSSGVGKTELAKSIAEIVFGSRSDIVRIDMSEFKEQHNSARLLGAPAGYVGYKEQNSFTDQIRKKPHTLILFDEIDKAHPDILTILFQMLDEGHITDGSGKKINFKNTIIIMTAAMGLEGFVSGSVGFDTSSTDTKESEFLKQAARVRELLKEKFKGELLNRIDKIVVFKPLSKEDINGIITKELKEVEKRVATLGYTLSVGPTVKERLVTSAHIPEQGARLVRKIIADLIEDPLSTYLVNENPRTGSTLSVSLRAGEVKVQSK